VGAHLHVLLARHPRQKAISTSRTSRRLQCCGRKRLFSFRLILWPPEHSGDQDRRSPRANDAWVGASDTSPRLALGPGKDGMPSTLSGHSAAMYRAEISSSGWRPCQKAIDRRQPLGHLLSLRGLRHGEDFGCKIMSAIGLLLFLRKMPFHTAGVEPLRFGASVEGRNLRKRVLSKK
jgi:hypothetical protein